MTTTSAPRGAAASSAMGSGKEGLTLTEFGFAFAQRLTAGFHELRQALALADREAANTVVVSVAPEFAARWLAPRLGGLYEIHPELILRFNASTRDLDFNRSDVDLAIRFGGRGRDWGESELLFEQQVFPVCAQRVAERLRVSADLAQEWSIDDATGAVRWRDWFRAGSEAEVALRPGASFSDPGIGFEAAIAGQGVMLGWPLLVADALADGRLACPFPPRETSRAAYVLIAPRGRRSLPSVQAFRRWLSQHVAAPAR
jgi:DNA-binding transcriptional LysR family regulator